MPNVALSPDGTIVASISGEQNDYSNKTITLWNTVSGRLVKQIVVHTFCAKGIVFSPDGSKVALCGVAHVLLWDIKKGSINTFGSALDFDIEDDFIKSIEFSPDSTILVGCYNHRITVWDVESGHVVLSFPNYDYFAPNMCIAFSPDGSVLAVAVGPRVDLWDFVSSDTINNNNGLSWNCKIKEFAHSVHSGIIFDIAFSPDSTKLAISGKAVTLWDIETGALIKKFAERIDYVNSIVFSADSTKLIGTTDHTLRVWCIETGHQLKCFKYTNLRLSRVAFSGDSSIVAFDCNSIVHLINVASGKHVLKINKEQHAHGANTEEQTQEPELEDITQNSMTQLSTESEHIRHVFSLADKLISIQNQEKQFRDSQRNLTEFHSYRQVERLPRQRKRKREYKYTNVLNAESQCSICLDPLFSEIDHKNVIVLPCNHLFHQVCINNWHNQQQTCPICKDTPP